MRRLLVGAGVLAVALAAAPGWSADPAVPPTPATMSSFFSGGYLPQGAAPDSLKLDPPPPAAGSGAQARDDEAAAQAVALQGSARWEQARIDADLSTPAATGVFSCAAGRVIGAATPRTDNLLRRAGRDLAAAVYPSKRKYQRARPFMSNGKPICTPEMDAGLRKDGSYPSGHSAIGYGWGLVLAELVPARSAELVARGRAFGDSRRVCNVHWLSDVEEGRVVASAVVARLHAEPGFRADLDAARAELAAVAPLAADCAREDKAFAGV